MLACRISTITGPGATTSSPVTSSRMPNSRLAAAKSAPAHSCWKRQVPSASHARRAPNPEATHSPVSAASPIVSAAR